MNLFVDTSAMVKLYHQEKGTDSFTNLLNSHSSDLVITIADITRIEFRSAFLKRVRVKEIGLDTARKLFEAFDNDVQMFNSIEIDDVVKSLAIQLMDSVAYQIPLRALCHSAFCRYCFSSSCYCRFFCSL